MTLKELYEALSTVEKGSEMEAFIKAEITKLNNEAAKYRNELNAAKKTNTDILSALGLQDSEAALEEVQKLKEEIDVIRSTGKKPDELAGLTKKVETLTKSLADMTAANEAEKAKGILATKTNAALAALQKHNAADPSELVKLIIDKIETKEDGSLKFKHNDTEYDVEAGVGEWSKGVAWAFKNTASAGAGGGSPATGGTKAPTNLHEAVSIAMGESK